MSSDWLGQVAFVLDTLGFLLLLLSCHPWSPLYPWWPPPSPRLLLLLSGSTGLLQLIIRMGRPIVNDHLDGPAFCKWSSGLVGLLHVIIWIGRTFANDHWDGQAFCKWSSRFLPFNQILLHFYFYFQQISYFPPTNIIFSFKTFLLLQISLSRFNVADLSWTMCYFNVS